ncbi:IclR family transcriptional regulator [Halostella sp. JP-L12]|uniref:IclR family transcriptional regulator n=1 Tax=Halostella TaxID=1843185 RepID=UPI000EF77434|nr:MULTISPECIES: IclR family transcriptional regulator [Halostella]NHN47856.1 IclR family transcriptional regulator [Halostella sp. JP-L12]
MLNSDDARTVQSVQTALDIVDFLAANSGARVTELADELDRSKGTIHSHLATLHENEYVIKDGDEYRLSLRYLHLGETVKDRLGIFETVKDELDDLAAETGELAQFATIEHGRAVYLYKTGGPKAVQTASTVGKREYLHCISLGKAMLAHLPRERVDEIVDRHGLPGYTDRTITAREELYEALDRVRDRGYAVDNEEKIEGLRCVAAPVKSTGSGALGAVSISGPSSRMVGERFEEELPSKVMRSANVIEINTKFS